MNRIRRKLIVLVMILVLVTPVVSSAASNRIKQTVYNQVIKKGNKVICIGSSGMYRVNMRGHIPKSKKRIQKVEDPFFEGYRGMRTYGNRLYFVRTNTSYYVNIYRTDFNGKKKIDFTPKGRIGLPAATYAIYKRKLYITENDDYETRKWVMTPTGKNKRGTKYRVVQIEKNSNVKGYSVKTIYKKGYYYDYLKTPKKTYYLGKVKSH